MKNIGVAFQLPKYWNILSDFDKYQYNCMRLSLSTRYSKNQRNKRVENFTEILEIIKRYCLRGDGDDWRRCLVCGYCCFPDGIAINTRQLRLLIFKCKSSINGSLHKMGFSAEVARSEAANSLMMSIPVLRDNMNELRQWTVRKINSSMHAPVSPPVTSPQDNATTNDSYVKINVDGEKNMMNESYSQKNTNKNQNDRTDYEEIKNQIFDGAYNFLFDIGEYDNVAELDFL